MSFHNLSISVLKVGRQLAGSLVVAAFLMPSLIGCIKEELPVQPRQPGDVTTKSISLSSDYRNQIFFSLQNDSIVAKSVKTDWDLAFDANTEGYKVYLNQAKFMKAAVTNLDDTEGSNDTTGFEKNSRLDASNIQDSLAIGDVRDLKKVLWIDRGYDSNNDKLNLVKIQFKGVDGNKYSLKVGRNGSSKSATFDIPKDKNFNRVYFSLTTNSVVKVEPPKTEWDFVFTQYVYTFKQPNLPYLVVGALLNPYNTTAIADSSLSFNNIDRTIAESFKLTNKPDVIGYNWKEYGFGSSIYRVKTQYNYIIRDSKGTLYKMRFLDFYDDKGQKGNPKFEFQNL